MSDLIKKKDVLALVKSYIEASAERMENDGYYEAQFEGFEELQDDLFNLETFPSADRPQEWIPCSERLPKENTEVLMSLEWGIDIGECRNGDWHSEWINHYDDDNVLAWMPLPKPWKGADDEDN